MCGERVVIVSHHDYAKQCTARGGCVHSRRNLVLVVFTIAAPLVSFPTDFKGTTSHDVFAVPTHHLYSATPLSRSSNSFQPDVNCSSVHLNQTGEISWFLPLSVGGVRSIKNLVSFRFRIHANSVNTSHNRVVGFSMQKL